MVDSRAQKVTSRASKAIVALTDSQVPVAGALLARAFYDDPLMIYSIPNALERERLLPEVYARMIRFGTLAGEVYTTADFEGVALWMPPGATWPREKMVASGMNEIATIIGPAAYQRYRDVVSREWQARERDMDDDCWYLFLLGVEPRLQHRGLGGALIRPVLERADAARVPCYLETENERNVAFYKKQGFDLIVNGEEADSTGVRFWSFKRLPRP
jgi:ribosomal protein S18 acetylase RimI-like enzyme